MRLSRIIIRFLYLFLIVLLCLSISCKKERGEAPWRPLFNGQSLNGWSVKGGEAVYEVRDGFIVGKTVANTPNTFLVTDEVFGDFILELEYQVDPSMNSGIQIRSNSFPYYQNGRVHGYQIEIDPSDRSWSAGIYDEGRRGWLYPLEDNVEAQEAFKQNKWNHYRIEAIGDTIRTWINNIPAAHLIDEQTGQGFIGLQVHSIGTDQMENTEVLWRNIRILTDSLELYAKSSSLPPLNTKNRLLHNEAEAGWQLLWDGESTSGWKGAKLDHFPEEGWNVENGELTVLASGGGESEAGGDIVTLQQYMDFELQLDFKLSRGANSGIKYYVDTDLNQGPGSAIGLEFQILDDAHHPDAQLGNHEGSRTIGSLYDLIMANPEKHVNPIGEWNHARILSKDNHVEHWLNGMKVLEYERGSEEFRKLVSESKYKIWPGFGEAEQGPILLQDHGDLVSFKNIKIRPISKEAL